MGIQESFSANGHRLGVSDVSAEFYPYAELKHTWRGRGSALSFRISDYLADAPPEVIDSLSVHLLSKARRVECPEERRRPYLEYSRSRELWASKRALYLSRARSLSLNPKGGVRDLEEVFRYLNSLYFGERIEQPQLAWSSESPSRRLGWYFEPLNLLAVNRAFDSSGVPRYALEFVMYHELLHHIRGDVSGVRRRACHDKGFRAAEREFRRFEDADPWLRKLAVRRRDR